MYYLFKVMNDIACGSYRGVFIKHSI